VSLYAGAFKKIPGKFELTVLMTRTMFPFFPLVALAAAFVGILNACGMFFLPAFSSAIFNLVSIVTGVFFAFLLPRFGIQPIAGMAIGVVLGGFAQAFCQLPSLYRKGYRWESFQPGEVSWYQDPALRRMLVLMIPGTVGLAATQVNIFVNSLLATSQGAGAVSWLNYAFRLMQFPIGILGVSLAAATLPRVSKLWVEGDFAGVEATLGRSLKHVFAANLPAAAGLAALGCPIIRLIFEYGHFQETDTKRTAAALAAYAVGLAAYSVVKVLVPAFYGMGNTKVPVASSIFSVVLTVILNFIMIGPFGYVGLALGTSIAAIVNAVILVIAARVVLVKQGGDFALKSVGISFFRQLVLSVAMGAACYWSYLFLDGVFPDVALWSWLGRAGVVLARIFKMGILVTEGVFVVWGLARLLRVEETLEIFNLFASKLKNKLSVVKK
jgi:putative peptidoglycan lipid II flippase